MLLIIRVVKSKANKVMENTLITLLLGYLRSGDLVRLISCRKMVDTTETSETEDKGLSH